ncbi:putative reverse transcriptase domain-containing protein [Tanacetum coccineum]
MSSSPHSTIVPSDFDINDAIPPHQVIIALPAMPPKRTSTSAAPTMTEAAIRQLITDALKAQAASMASASNPNKNTGTSRTPVARKGINDHKRKFEDRGNTTNNNNYPKHNKQYQPIIATTTSDNNNKNNHNNDYHQQQNRRQETVRTYPAKKYHGNLPLCTRCTLHHTRVCTVKCRICNKVGHLTRNCRSKGPATGSNLLSVSVTVPCNVERKAYQKIWLDDKLNYVEESVEIMDREVKQLRRRCIPIVKVRWNSEFTWEREDQIRAKYPHLFSNIIVSNEGDNEIDSLTKEPFDTLLMGDEVISTTPKRENNEFIKSSVDDLVPIRRESEVTSVCDDLECDMPVNTPSTTTDVRE